MGTSLGELEAQRILRARQSDANQAAQEARNDRILCTEQPRFFGAMADDLAKTVQSFNLSMGLEGQDAVTFVHSGSQIQIGRRESHFSCERSCISSAPMRWSFALKSSMVIKKRTRMKSGTLTLKTEC
jgi:hypothetical protein